VAVLLAVSKKKAVEPICAPKGIGPRPVGHFSCKAATSKGAAMGAMGADHGPPRLPAVCVRAGAVTEGHAPLWQYLSALGTGRRKRPFPAAEAPR
jgi:hypothetical protein